MSTSADLLTKLSNLLPTGTFLAFQVIAPLATNNGNCGLSEKILTAVTLALLSLGCIITSFTDSYNAADGTTYTGLLTYKGLWIPSIEKSKDDGVENRCYCGPGRVDLDKYKPHIDDYFNAVLSVVSFLTLTMFTTPVTTCYYPHISESLLKTVPLLVAAVVSFVCSFAPKLRNGLGFAMPNPTPDPAPVPLLQVSDPDSHA